MGKGGHVWVSLGSLGPRMTDAQNVSMMRLAVHRRRLGAHHFTMQNMATQLRVAKYEAERLMFCKIDMLLWGLRISSSSFS